MLADEQELATWLATLTYADVRKVEQPLPAIKWDGGRLRGVQIIRGLYLDRHRRFYLGRGLTALATELTLHEVCGMVSPSLVKRQYRVAAMHAARRRVKARRRSRSPRRSS